MGNCFSPSTFTDSSAEPTPTPLEHEQTAASSRRLSSAAKGKERVRDSLSRHHRRTSSFLMGTGPSLGALRTYATLPNPSTALPPSKLLLSTPNTIAVFDAYPKSKYHFLVLPRYPFPPQSEPDSNRSIVPLEALDDLKSLLLKADRRAKKEVLRAMADTAREVEEMIRDEMLKTEGFEWKIDVGFHAIPSMKHVHLHVISEDRISPALKTKKHHNSFRPDLGFFISIMEVQRWIQDDQNTLDRIESLSGAQALLDTPLTCFKCDEPFSNIPKLKQHMEKEFAKEKEIALKHIARHGRQRSSDEEMF
ncbi:hypothetical protein CI109_102408 [Kwoniella shandongensis]|uniref:Uncharacterized protein n=1 Tax=Kwoniella shandongensis TaxID=1734106 RepID=A0A5M6C030_9TREE|nr:uncharacterized protein CI109_003273 [Kwoniella shandongensis]KAA5528373.1 hypothetical protein CI109_003273 [Kwoniella shandongensis]